MTVHGAILTRDTAGTIVFVATTTVELDVIRSAGDAPLDAVAAQVRTHTLHRAVVDTGTLRLGTPGRPV